VRVYHLVTAASPLSAAPLATDTYARHVVARLLDFFADTSPWPRRLWEVSSVLALREAAEAGDWIRLRVLTPGAVSWYLRALERQLGPDRGLGDTQLRKELTTLLHSELAPDSRDRRRISPAHANDHERLPASVGNRGRLRTTPLTGTAATGSGHLSTRLRTQLWATAPLGTSVEHAARRDTGGSPR
jgi:hypothetical protein